MSKIIRVKEQETVNLAVDMRKDFGMFQVEARVYLMVEKVPTDIRDVYLYDISDTTLTFYVNNKECLYKGFQELYTKLHGENAFDKFEDTCIAEFEKVSVSPKYPDVEALDVATSERILSEYLESGKVSTLSSEEKELLYTSDWMAINLAKPAGLSRLIRREELPNSLNPDGKAYTHKVLDVGAFCYINH